MKKYIHISLLLILAFNQSCSSLHEDPDPFGDDKGKNVLGFKVGDHVITQFFDHNFFGPRGRGTDYYFYHIFGEGWANWDLYSPEKAKNDTLSIWAYQLDNDLRLKSLIIIIPMSNVVNDQPLSLNPESIILEANISNFQDTHLYEKWDSYPRLVVEDFSIAFDTLDYDNARFEGSFHMRFQMPFETDDYKLKWKKLRGGGERAYYQPLEVPDVFETTDGRFSLKIK